MIDDILETIESIDTQILELQDQRRSITSRLNLVAERYYQKNPKSDLLNPDNDSKCCTAGVFVFFETTDLPLIKLIHPNTYFEEEYVHFTCSCPWCGESGFGLDVPISEFTQENLAL